MTLLASKLGIRLIVWLGQSAPKPAGADVMSALQRVEVTNTMDGEDGFQMELAMSKNRRGEFGLLSGGALDPGTRVVIGVLIGATLRPLMDGVIYNHQLAPGQDPGTFTLTVMGRSLLGVLDLKPASVAHANQSSSAIVTNILSQYQTYGITDLSGVTQTNDVQSDKDYTARQRGTDLAYIRELAEKKKFIFCLEPQTLGTTAAYWGPADGNFDTLPDLLVHLGLASNVSDIHFALDALAAVTVTGDIVDPTTLKSQPIPPPPQPTAGVGLQPVTPLRSELVAPASRLGPAGAQDAAAAQAAAAPDPLKTTGTLETVIYGDVLRARRRVSVRGGGQRHDGVYIVRQVTHDIAVGKYTQRFTLGRKSLGTAN